MQTPNHVRHWYKLLEPNEANRQAYIYDQKPTVVSGTGEH